MQISEGLSYCRHRSKSVGRRISIPTIALVLCALPLCGSSTSLSGVRFPSPAQYLGKRQTSDSSQNFNWSSINPSDQLNWTQCYGPFECARLAVPLDYSNTSGQQAAIAITKFPSKIPPGKEGYRGPILFNPGGPGGSGVDQILNIAQSAIEILGDDFDLIGFDPRGIGFTTPGMFTYTDVEEVNVLNNFQKAANETNDSLGALYAFSQTMGKVAKARIPDIAQHVSTPTVARDMLSIVKAFGQDKLQYWGISYGSVLGATFAAMFPDKIGRLVIDGVVDSEGYYKGQYSHELQDTDKILLSIYQACLDAGPSVCPIHESSTNKIAARVNALFDSLKVEPISFYNETSGEYGVLDYSAARGAFWNALYTPYLRGAPLTFAVAAAERGEGQPLFDQSSLEAIGSDLCDCSTPLSTPSAGGLENVIAIRCGDSGPSNVTLDDLRIIYEDMAKDSQFAEMWPVYAGCAGWEITTKDRFSASFKTNTSFPILLIGNTADPVAPIAGARKMSQDFIDSVLLTQDSVGHTSIIASSNCTHSAIRNYIRDGILPENGTICSVESSIFGPFTNTTASVSTFIGV